LELTKSTRRCDKDEACRTPPPVPGEADIVGTGLGVMAINVKSLGTPNHVNIVALEGIGRRMRALTSHITHEELPKDIDRLLKRLERVDVRRPRKKASG
jgi:hypothetical protein